SKLWWASRLYEPRATLSLNLALNTKVSPRLIVLHCTGNASDQVKSMTGYSVSTFSLSLLQAAISNITATAFVIVFIVVVIYSSWRGYTPAISSCQFISMGISMWWEKLML